ncbi:MAG: hypothetical protein ACRDRX_14015 [Pseudonocardiaceae bacterium]
MSVAESGFNEKQWEELALEVLDELGWRPTPGSAIALGTDERQSWDELVIPSRLLETMRILNPVGRWASGGSGGGRSGRRVAVLGACFAGQAPGAFTWFKNRGSTTTLLVARSANLG